jgi:hypothetical protein
MVTAALKHPLPEREDANFCPPQFFFIGQALVVLVTLLDGATAKLPQMAHFIGAEKRQCASFGRPRIDKLIEDCRAPSTPVLPGLIKLAGIVRILPSVKTKLDLFTSVPGQRKRRYLVLHHECDSCCFHARLRFASQQAAKYK